MVFPPLPSLLILPWRAVTGGTVYDSGVLAALMGGATAGLAYRLLACLTKRGWTQHALTDHLWLASFIAFGSVYWSVATQGTVCFVVETCAAAYAMGAMVVAADGGPGWLSGVCLGAAMLGRPHIFLLSPLLLALALHGKPMGRGALAKWTAGLSLCVAGAALVLACYNLLRFGNPLDFAYERAVMKPSFKAEVEQYGVFSHHYVLRNLWAMWIAWPVRNGRGGLTANPLGMSIFLTTPAIITIFLARKPGMVVAAAWLSIIALLVPILLYYNTGWVQFGSRFSVDFLAALLILIALAWPDGVPKYGKALIAAGWLVNGWGVAWYTWG